MKKSFIKKSILASLILASVLTLVACGKKTTAGSKYDNESTPLVLSTQAPDGVFSPFFSTSAYDGEIAGITQISMLSTDSQGGVKVGANEACVVLDYTVNTVDTRADKTDKEDYDNYYTTYKFVIKNGLKFSDGVDLTIQDVLFNMYVYLDPTYTGSTTMYSVNIQGLKAYRAQSYDEGEQENVEKYFSQQASERIDNIRYYCDDMLDDALVSQVLSDIEMMKPLFRQELETDWNNADASISSFEDTYKFEEAWQVFLWNYGYISIKAQSDATWDEDTMGTECPEALNWNGWDTRGKNMTKEQIIDAVFHDKVENESDDTLKNNIKAIVTYYATAQNLKTELVAAAKDAYYEEFRKSGNLVVPNISGITTYKVSAFTGQSGVEENYSEEHDVLQIVINGVDPKAIWNFGFTVAPMHYYSTQEEVRKASITDNHFGVSYGDYEFMKQLQLKLVPMGAGAYKVTDKFGKGQVSKVADFFDANIAYFERNEYFFQPVKIKYLRYKVISSNKLYDAVRSGEVDYSDPSALVSTINEIDANYKDRIGYVLVDNLGYGYIGINASKINSLAVRRAIMYSMDTSLVLQYYTNEMASVIYRGMSKVSWAYPEGATAFYPFVGTTYGSEEDQIEFIKAMIEEDGWEMRKDGLYHKKNEISNKDESLTFTFSLAGETTDHPAYNTFHRSQELLNKCGFKVTVVNDPNALSKLSHGDLTVWAAAWGSTIDPDMYQVYHKDSTATSVNNWGYPHLLDNGSEEELQIIEDLSALIDAGRETVVKEERIEIYKNALDKVMELAVELPTYQRKNLFVYNSAKIDKTTLCQDITPYNGPLSRIWEVSFNQ